MWSGTRPASYLDPRPVGRGAVRISSRAPLLPYHMKIAEHHWGHLTRLCVVTGKCLGTRIKGDINALTVTVMK